MTDPSATPNPPPDGSSSGADPSGVDPSRADPSGAEQPESSTPPASPWPGGQIPVPTAAPAAPRRRSPVLVIGIVVVLVAIVGAALYLTRNSVQANDLAIGTCFDVPSGDTVSTVTQHPCTESHDAEVFSVTTFTGSDNTYPDASAFDDYAQTTCEPAFESYVGESVDDSPYVIGYLFPSSDSWGNGDRQVTCYASNEDGSKLAQSIKGSAPAS